MQYYTLKLVCLSSRLDLLALKSLRVASICLSLVFKFNSSVEMSVSSFRRSEISVMVDLSSSF